MAVSNSKSSTNKTLTKDRFDLPDDDYRKEAFELKALIENTQVMILVFQDQRICYANPLTKILTGYNQNELLTKTSLSSQFELWQHYLISEGHNHGVAHNQEIKLLTKNGQECWLDCTFKLIQFANQPAIAISAVDITKYKQAEQKIQQVLEQEKKLVSMVSHELRTPMNVISFSSNVLKSYGDRWKPAKVKQYLERVQRGVDTLSLLIDEWLILGKVEVGKLKFQPQPFDLEKFCRNLLSDLQLDNDQPRQINFFNQADNSLVNFDPRILQLILTNLLENAIKYSPEGKAINFTVASSSQKVIFKIKDRGMGIKQSDQRQLFEPFYRGKNVEHIPGHGLGLAIVKKLVELSDGQIKVESQWAKGTQFTISFPQTS